MSGYKSDIEIAQETELMPIEAIAEKLGLTRDDIELYGNYKAKIDYTKFNKKKIRQNLYLLQPLLLHLPEREKQLRS